MPETTPQGASTRIDICIATCNRPEMLRSLLASLSRMAVRDGWALRIIVVDNDPAGSARSTVESFAAQSGIPVIYALEPEKGVSQARNRALALADGDFIAFVDDDETVEPGWLAALLDTSLHHGADVVFGPVLSSLPPDAPAWIRTSGLFDRPRFPTGTLRPSGGAGSVLLRAETVRRAGRGFDPAFGLCGGEDTEYFSHLGRSGARMVWCDEAVAWEAVTKDRATLGWLLRRNYNSGRVYSRIALPRQTPLGRAAALARCALGILVLCLVTPLALLAGRHVAARLFMRLARGLGRLSAGVGCLKPARSGS